MHPTKVRLSLEVSPEVNATLERLAVETHSTKSEVLRKAIALIDVAVDAKEHGRALGIVDDPAVLKTRIVGL